ncbi:MAG: aminotransferase class I/II-fold pyridoxal phosphate-dependent enzyme [Bacillota bacterium]|nr:aminotransferase class I/II-fold pyridoxal phosphate-dependent enzyme [Bacillota bacterium]
MIDLSSNENPYEPSNNTINAANRGLKNLNKYIDKKNINELKKILGNYNNVSTERIILGSGTENLFKEIIYNFSKNRNIITFNPSFMNSINIAKYNAKKIIKVQLTPPEFKVNWKSLINEPSLVIIDSPNNPTGKCLITRDDVINLLKNKNCLLLIDEAYYEFSKTTFVDLIDEYPNLAVSRTLDKAYSLAGLKISYLIVGDVFLNRLHHYSPSINNSTCLASIQAIKEKEYALNNVEIIINERNRVSNELKKIGFEVYDSSTNFLLIKSPISELALKLKKRKILISDLSTNWFYNYYRISIASPKENNILITTVKKLINNN